MIELKRCNCFYVRFLSKVKSCQTPGEKCIPLLDCSNVKERVLIFSQLTDSEKDSIRYSQCGLLGQIPKVSNITENLYEKKVNVCFELISFLTTDRYVVDKHQHRFQPQLSRKLIFHHLELVERN